MTKIIDKNPQISNFIKILNAEDEYFFHHNTNEREQDKVFSVSIPLAYLSDFHMKSKVETQYNRCLYRVPMTSPEHRPEETPDFL